MALKANLFVCFISTIEKTPLFLEMLPSIKIHLQWGGGEAIKAHKEENIFSPEFFNLLFPSLGLPHSTNSCLCQKLYVM